MLCERAHRRNSAAIVLQTHFRRFLIQVCLPPPNSDKRKQLVSGLHHKIQATQQYGENLLAIFNSATALAQTIEKGINENLFKASDAGALLQEEVQRGVASPTPARKIKEVIVQCFPFRGLSPLFFSWLGRVGGNGSGDIRV